MNEENIVKKTCKELGLTYRELGNKIGIKENSLRVMVSKDNITEQVRSAINLLIENETLKESLSEYKQLGTLLNKLTKG
jgi:hypothetical protein